MGVAGTLRAVYAYVQIQRGIIKRYMRFYAV